MAIGYHSICIANVIKDHLASNLDYCSMMVYYHGILNLEKVEWKLHQ